MSAILLLPLAPVRATTWVANTLVDVAEKEHCGPDAIRTRLTALNRSYEAGEIDEEEFEAAEDRLLDLLDRSQAKAETDEAKAKRAKTR